MQRLILPFLCLILAVPCKADTIIVDQNGFADFNNIQDAINYSWHGDTIVVQPGDYNDPFYFNNRAVTVTSTDSNDPNVVDMTVIAAQVTFDFLEDNNSVLTGFTITGSGKPAEAGIECWGTSPTITKNNIVSSYSIQGYYDASPTISLNTISEASYSILDCHGIISHNHFYNNGIPLKNCDGTISNNTIQGNSDYGLTDCDGTIVDNTIADNNNSGLRFCDGDITNNIIRDNGNSWAEHGGGLYDCDANIIGNTIMNNIAEYDGGGLYHCDGDITNNIIINNYAGGGNGGGGLCSCNGDVTDNVIIGNYARDGGGLSWCNGNIINNTIADNNAVDRYGGGLYHCDGNIINNTISDNKAVSGGGGLYHCYGDITDNIIINNYAGVSGGGLDLCSFGNIANNLITGNAGQLGGGLYGCSNTNIISNTIVGNSAADTGGAISRSNTTTRNNIIAFNKAPNVGGIYGTCKNNYNAFWGNGINFGGGAYGRTGDISANPLFALDGYWDANDYWIDGDYHLKSEAGRWDPNQSIWVYDANISPCIDAGDPNADWAAELWPHGKRINMGVYGSTPEASMSLSDAGNIANLDNDPADNVDFNDLDIFVSKWCEEEVLIAEDLDRDGVVNFVDYAIFADEWLW